MKTTIETHSKNAQTLKIAALQVAMEIELNRLSRAIKIADGSNKELGDLLDDIQENLSTHYLTLTKLNLER